MISELTYISEHFDKLFSNCHNHETYNPPLFNTSSDINALIVMQEIVKILAGYQLYPNNIDSRINAETLVQIINVKCSEYCNQNIFGTYNVFANSENFKTSFYASINNMVSNYISNIS
jgi:hypothetical protein